MNQPTLREKQGYSANFKFRKSLSTEETLLKEIRKFTIPAQFLAHAQTFDRGGASGWPYIYL